ncbi:5'-methylthioadenosine/S-adenosylhomocysteine nucleosidase [Spiroplasma endosymbiont of Aspidapion aeneum]|uniref:5'-methylthioadenosine/S-adenosylhomocysteine nucleosidase family protein n=1 Tax=Spiroplasma endosymbiont of Aspidapion aeneum TaxID=3066276 RepID=UPI00313C9C77
MEEEVQDLQNSCDYVKILAHPYQVWENDKSFIVVCGIGIARSSACTGWVIEKLKPTQIINIGLCGATESNSILDGLFIKKAYYSAVDLTPFGYDYGQHSKGKKFYQSNIENVLKVKEANIASSDIFINNIQGYDNFIKKINDKIELFDMECCSIFQICDEFGIKYGAIKIVSDVLNKYQDNKFQFEEIILQGAKKIKEIVSKINKKI